ncbi:hypothetical protein F3K46_02045 [Thermoanaerobacterium thermosaccharolyticum]|nr:hypothetical protein [Thermoanaerobacterium thermosaccharolyticum]MBE0227426.1 hypothetical protein [Thermoanaerobacterium thermosaccharolyticum]
MCLTPIFITLNEGELYDHYRSIAESENILILLDNNPPTGVKMSANLVKKLADIPNIIDIKDSSGNLTLTSKYIIRNREKEFNIFAQRIKMKIKKIKGNIKKYEFA